MSKVMDVLLKYGKITQEQYDAIAVKEAGKKAVIDDYKANKAKKTKAELCEIIDTLM